MILLVIFPNIPSNLPDLHSPMTLSIGWILYKIWFEISPPFPCHCYVLTKSIQSHNNRKIGARYQLAKPWGKTPACTSILPLEVVHVLPCMYIFQSEQTQQYWYQQVKWNRNEIENIIQCKIIANSNISNIKPSACHTSITRKLHEIGRKFSQTLQDTVVSGRDFRHSRIKKMSNAILKRAPLIWNHQQMLTSCTSNIRLCNQ